MKNSPIYDHAWVVIDRFSKQTLPVEIPEEATTKDLVRIFWNRIYPIMGVSRSPASTGSD